MAEMDPKAVVRDGGNVRSNIASVAWHARHTTVGAFSDRYLDAYRVDLWR